MSMISQAITLIGGEYDDGVLQYYTGFQCIENFAHLVVDQRDVGIVVLALALS